MFTPEAHIGYVASVADAHDLQTSKTQRPCSADLRRATLWHRSCTGSRYGQSRPNCFTISFMFEREVDLTV